MSPIGTGPVTRWRFALNVSSIPAGGPDNRTGNFIISPLAKVKIPKEPSSFEGETKKLIFKWSVLFYRMGFNTFVSWV